MYDESVQKLDNMRKEGLRKVYYHACSCIHGWLCIVQALLEERKLYCFTMEHFCNVFKAEADYYAKVTDFIMVHVHLL